MAILVDDAFIQKGRNTYCHMASDDRTEAGIAELHKFAADIGLKYVWFQRSNRDHPHYDVNLKFRGLAVLCGAEQVNGTEFVLRCSWSKVADELRKQKGENDGKLATSGD